MEIDIEAVKEKAGKAVLPLKSIDSEIYWKSTHGCRTGSPLSTILSISFWLIC